MGVDVRLVDLASPTTGYDAWPMSTPAKPEVKMSQTSEGMSLGAQRVRESFNPSKDNMVDKIKKYTADLIDICNEGQGKGVTSEERRLWSLAMTSYEEAAMWAVKAATTGK